MSKNEGLDALVERTPQDYAIEHAEYMAKAAEGFLDAANKLRAMESGEAVPELMSVERASEAYTDNYRNLTYLIYEFRKRASRAALAAQPAREPVAQLDTRRCTCHPDDNPPVPCQKKYALSECLAAAKKPRHEWDRDGERCLKCGQKDWMDGECSAQGKP